MPVGKVIGLSRENNVIVTSDGHQIILPNTYLMHPPRGAKILYEISPSDMSPTNALQISDTQANMMLPPELQGMYLAIQEERGETLLLYKGRTPKSFNNIRVRGVHYHSGAANHLIGIHEGEILEHQFLYSEDRPEGKLHKVIGIRTESVVRGRWGDGKHLRSLLYLCTTVPERRGMLEQQLLPLLPKTPIFSTP